MKVTAKIWLTSAALPAMAGKEQLRFEVAKYALPTIP
jgi:hypothetical protein